MSVGSRASLGAHKWCCRAQERIYLSKRKGFVKVAMQAGADIVPTYILGQSQVINVSACLMQGCQSISLDQATQILVNCSILSRLTNVLPANTMHCCRFLCIKAQRHYQDVFDAQLGSSTDGGTCQSQTRFGSQFWLESQSMLLKLRILTPAR